MYYNVSQSDQNIVRTITWHNIKTDMIVSSETVKLWEEKDRDGKTSFKNSERPDSRHICKNNMGLQ
jgi:hypothetical protein